MRYLSIFLFSERTVKKKNAFTQNKAQIVIDDVKDRQIIVYFKVSVKKCFFFIYLFILNKRYDLGARQRRKTYKCFQFVAYI